MIAMRKQGETVLDNEKQAGWVPGGSFGGTTGGTVVMDDQRGVRRDVNSRKRKEDAFLFLGSVSSASPMSIYCEASKERGSRTRDSVCPVYSKFARAKAREKRIMMGGRRYTAEAARSGRGGKRAGECDLETWRHNVHR